MTHALVLLIYDQLLGFGTRFALIYLKSRSY